MPESSSHAGFCGCYRWSFTSTLLLVNVEDVARRADTSVRARYINTRPISTVKAITVTFINICTNNFVIIHVKITHNSTYLYIFDRPCVVHSQVCSHMFQCHYHQKKSSFQKNCTPDKELNFQLYQLKRTRYVINKQYTLIQTVITDASCPISNKSIPTSTFKTSNRVCTVCIFVTVV